MIYMVRDLVRDSHYEAGILGNGKPMTSFELERGISTLNLILDELFAKRATYAVISKSVNFSGAIFYSVGSTPEVGDPTPDIVLDVMPENIEKVIIDSNGSRLECFPVNGQEYHARTEDLPNNNYPTQFYFERTSSPLSYLKFYDGAPSLQGELIYSAPLANVTANTHLNLFPRAIRPYLTYALSARLMEQNNFDGLSMQVRANNAFNAYIASCHEPDAPMSRNSNIRFNIYRGD